MTAEPETEEIIVCRAHRRRCYIATAPGGKEPQLWHEGIGRNGGNLCTSQRLLFRVEQELSRQEILARHV